MIKLDISDSGTLIGVQRDESPTIYFDHWAIRLFSERDDLAQRLVSIVKQRSGTLALSWANVAEFTKMTSSEQAVAAENLLESLLPHLFFIEVNPQPVIAREDACLAGQKDAAPHADNELLGAFMNLKPSSTAPFTARGLFAAVGLQGMVERLAQLGDVFAVSVNGMRDAVQSDVSFLGAMRRTPKDPALPRGTRFILRELARSVVLDKGTKVDQNDAVDFYHALVPAAYCDFVLVDKYWEEQLQRVRRKFTKAGGNVPMAAVFSNKGESVQRFLEALAEVAT